MRNMIANAYAPRRRHIAPHITIEDCRVTVAQHWAEVKDVYVKRGYDAALVRARNVVLAYLHLGKGAAIRATVGAMVEELYGVTLKETPR